MGIPLHDACELNILVCIWNLDCVWTRVFVGCSRVKRKLYFHSKIYHIYFYCCTICRLLVTFREAGPCSAIDRHLTRKSGVLGSIPGLATYFRFSFRFFKNGSCQLLAKVCARSTG